MARALPLRWCKSTLPRFSESIVFKTRVPLTFDGIYNSKFTQYLLIHYCPHLTYLWFSPHHFCLAQSTEEKNHISFAMIAISRWFVILFYILMRFGTFRKYLTITKRKQDWWYTTHKFPNCISYIWLPLISQYSSLTGVQCKCSNPSSLSLAAFLIYF